MTISTIDLNVNNKFIAANMQLLFQGIEWIALSACFYWGKKLKIDYMICLD